MQLTPQGSNYPQPRDARPAYTAEQQFYIWYHKTDLGWKWDNITTAFNRYFRTRRPKGGLTCRFYRVLKEHGVETVRKQRNGRNDRRSSADGDEDDNLNARYGVLQRTNYRNIKWMLERHLSVRVLEQFAGRPDVRCGENSPCGRCRFCRHENR